MAGEISPISSKKMVPPSARRESPRLVLAGVGERTRLVAEQFRFQERVGQSGTIQGDEPLLATRRQAMDGPSE